MANVRDMIPSAQNIDLALDGMAGRGDIISHGEGPKYLGPIGETVYCFLNCILPGQRTHLLERISSTYKSL
jgi:hypothetical protein